MKYNELIFVSGSLEKISEVKRLLRTPINVIDIDLPEIQTLDLHELIQQKAYSAYEIVRKPVLVEDTSLVFDEWKNLPGPFIKWFIKELGNEGLSKIAHSLKSQNATATVIFGVFDGVELHIFEGVLKGKISKKELGNRKFGWDQIFIPNKQNKTIAQMTFEELDAISPRRNALVKLEEFLI